MGWETPAGGGRRYYTRSYRQQGRVRREYVGSGPRAEAIAAADEQARERHAAQRWEQTQAQQQHQAAERALTAYYASVEAQLRHALRAAGYHQHKRGEWRRRRGSTGA